MAAEVNISGSGSVTGSADVQLPNGTTRLALYYPDLTAPEPPEPEAEHPGLTLIKNDDCAACHNAEVDTVGPSYLAMARAYDDDPDTVTRLARRIIAGGRGQWGLVPMTAQPHLPIEQAAQMVRYILALAAYQGAATESPDTEP